MAGGSPSPSRPFHSLSHRYRSPPLPGLRRSAQRQPLHDSRRVHAQGAGPSTPGAGSDPRPARAAPGRDQGPTTGALPDLRSERSRSGHGRRSAGARVRRLDEHDQARAGGARQREPHLVGARPLRARERATRAELADRTAHVSAPARRPRPSARPAGAEGKGSPFREDHQRGATRVRLRHPRDDPERAQRRSDRYRPEDQTGSLDALLRAALPPLHGGARDDPRSTASRGDAPGRDRHRRRGSPRPGEDAGGRSGPVAQVHARQHGPAGGRPAEPARRVLDPRLLGTG